MKKGYKVDIENETVQNENYRKVLYTGEHSQLVLMSLKPNEEIGLETHEKIDQFFRFESGVGIVKINNSEYEVKNGDAVVVPSGCNHNIINTSNELPLKLYTIYSPPHHKDGLVIKNKSDEKKDEVLFDGKTSEEK